MNAGLRSRLERLRLHCYGLGNQFFPICVHLRQSAVKMVPACRDAVGLPLPCLVVFTVAGCWLFLRIVGEVILKFGSRS